MKRDDTFHMNKVVMLVLVCIVFFSFHIDVSYGESIPLIRNFGDLNADSSSSNTGVNPQLNSINSIRIENDPDIYNSVSSDSNLYKSLRGTYGQSQDKHIYVYRTKSGVIQLPSTFDSTSQRVSVEKGGFVITGIEGDRKYYYTDGDGIPNEHQSNMYSIKEGVVSTAPPGFATTTPLFDTRGLDVQLKVTEDGKKLQYLTTDSKWDDVTPLSDGRGFTIGSGPNAVDVKRENGMTTATQNGKIISAVVNNEVIRINHGTDDGSDSTDSTLTVGGRTFNILSAHVTAVSTAENIKTFHENYQNLQALERAGLPPGVRITEGLSVNSNGEITGKDIRPRSFGGLYDVNTKKGTITYTPQGRNPVITTTTVARNIVTVKREGQNTIKREFTDNSLRTLDSESILDSNDKQIMKREMLPDSQGNRRLVPTEAGEGQNVFVSPGLFGGERVRGVVAASNIKGVAFVTSSGQLLDENRNLITGKTRRELLKDNREKIDRLKDEAKDLETTEFKENIRAGNMEILQDRVTQRRQDFGIETVPGRIFDGVFQAVGAVRETYGISALFKDKEEIDQRLAEVRREMEDYYMRNIFESTFCEDVRESPLIQSQGVAFARMDDGTHKIAVSIQARKQPLVTPDGQEFLYTVTYQIRNDVQKNSPFAETWRYNVWLDGDISVRLWTMSRSVPPGGIELYTNRNQIVFYSERDYHTLCVEFDYHYAAIETTSVCNRVVTVNEEATPFVIPKTDSQGRPTANTPGASTKPELNIDEL